MIYSIVLGIENGPYERELVTQLLLFVLEQKVISREKITEGAEDALMALGLFLFKLFFISVLIK
jgi:hypothetical protein